MNARHLNASGTAKLKGTVFLRIVPRCKPVGCELAIATYRGETRGPCPRERSHHRSARACPSRTLGSPEHGGGQAPHYGNKAHLCSSGSPDPDPIAIWRSQTTEGKRGGPVPREHAFPITVARGPVPREPSIVPGMAGDRPPPYGGDGAFWRKPFFYRSARACPSRSLGTPEMAGDRPPPYGRRAPPVGQDRQILTRLRSPDPEPFYPFSPRLAIFPKL